MLYVVPEVITVETIDEMRDVETIEVLEFSITEITASLPSVTKIIFSGGELPDSLDFPNLIEIELYHVPNCIGLLRPVRILAHIRDVNLLDFGVPVTYCCSRQTRWLKIDSLEDLFRIARSQKVMVNLYGTRTKTRIEFRTEEIGTPEPVAGSLNAYGQCLPISQILSIVRAEGIKLDFGETFSGCADNICMNRICLEKDKDDTFRDQAGRMMFEEEKETIVMHQSAIVLLYYFFLHFHLDDLAAKVEALPMSVMFRIIIDDLKSEQTEKKIAGEKEANDEV